MTAGVVLGHRRFIEDFSKVSKHLSNHLQNTTRDLLIASRLIAGESILHLLGVTNFRPAALYPGESACVRRG
jgi:hypothetical protein